MVLILLRFHLLEVKKHSSMSCAVITGPSKMWRDAVFWFFIFSFLCKMFFWKAFCRQQLSNFHFMWLTIRNVLWNLAHFAFYDFSLPELLQCDKCFCHRRLSCHALTQRRGHDDESWQASRFAGQRSHENLHAWRFLMFLIMGLSSSDTIYQCLIRLLNNELDTE